MRPYKVLLPAAVAVILSTLGFGCATSKDMERVERQVSSVGADVGAVKGTVSDLDISMKVEAKRGKDIQAEMKAMEENQAQMAAVLKSLADDLAVVKRNQADLGSRMFTMAGGEISGFSGKMDEVKHDLETTNSKLDDMKAALLSRIAALEEAASKPEAGKGGETGRQAEGAGAGNAGAQAGQGAGAGNRFGNHSGNQAVPSTADPTQLYQAAYLDYTKGNYDVAITGFGEYMKSFPDGEFVGNAQYWIGESLYSLGKYEEADAEFEKVVKNYPDSPKVPGAILKQGFCHDALGKPAEARAAYELVMKKYPDSEAAKLAAEKLKPKTRGKVPGR